MAYLKMKYKNLLKITPDHLSEDFLEHLRTYKPEAVVKETKYWLIVENIKYHRTKEYEDHWTAFYKEAKQHPYEIKAEAIKELFDWMPEHRQLLLNRKLDRSISRFHVHIIK